MYTAFVSIKREKIRTEIHEEVALHSESL